MGQGKAARSRATRLHEAFVVCVLAGASCSQAPAPARAQVPHPELAIRAPTPEVAASTADLPPFTALEGPVPIVLVTIDGARWQEIFEGADATRWTSPAPRPSATELMPHLHAMDAAVGAPGRGLIRATGPNFVSLPGYREILSGHASAACQDNNCPPITSTTVLDQASDAGLRVAAFGSWETLARAATSQPGAFVASFGRGDDPDVDPWPGQGDFRPDGLTAQRALEHLVSERPDVLFLGLGEPDEYAHHGDYAGYIGALRAADAILGRLEQTLAQMGPRGAATHVLVTADHGRANDFASHGGFAPESARVWLFARGPRFRARGAVRSPTERHLSDLAPTMRALLGLSAPAGDPGDGTVLVELLGG